MRKWSLLASFAFTLAQTALVCAQSTPPEIPTPPATWWLNPALSAPSGLRVAASLDDQFVIAGKYGLHRSKNGLDWEKIADAPAADWQCGTQVGDEFLLFANQPGQVIATKDGVHFETRFTAEDYAFLSVRLADGQLVAEGQRAVPFDPNIVNGTTCLVTPSNTINFPATSRNQPVDSPQPQVNWNYCRLVSTDGGRSWVETDAAPSWNNGAASATGLGLTVTVRMVPGKPPGPSGEPSIPFTTEFLVTTPGAEPVVAQTMAGTAQQVLFGNNRFVAISIGGQSFASEDGWHWTPSHNSAQSGPNNEFYFQNGLFYFVNSTWVPVGAPSDPNHHQEWRMNVATSPDGLTWTQIQNSLLRYTRIERATSGDLTIEARISRNNNSEFWLMGPDGAATLDFSFNGHYRNFAATSNGFICLDASNSVYFRLEDHARLPSVNIFQIQFTEENNLQIAWEAIPGAVAYRLYRQIGAGDPSGWELIAETADTSFLDENLSAGQRYLYFVMGLEASGREGLPSEVAFGYPQRALEDYLIEMSATFCGELNAVQGWLDLYLIDEKSATLGTTITQDAVTILAGQVDLLTTSFTGYGRNSVYGDFYAPFFPWTNSAALGWCYNVGVPAQEKTGLWLYQPDHGWLYTQEDWYPFLWERQNGQWLWIDLSNGNDWYRYFDESGKWTHDASAGGVKLLTASGLIVDWSEDCSLEVRPPAAP